jgi:hypothetical protein
LQQTDGPDDESSRRKQAPRVESVDFLDMVLAFEGESSPARRRVIKSPG